MPYCVISHVRQVSLFNLLTKSFCLSVFGGKTGSTEAAGSTAGILSTELIITAERVLTEGLVRG